MRAPRTMRRVPLGRTGVEVPALSLGTWAHGGPRTFRGESVGWAGTEDREARAALVRAWELGVTHWDTADVYGDGHAESLIGSVWNAVPRDEIFLATKTGWDPGPHEHYYHPHHVRARLERSLALLATDRVDLYYLHHCDFGPDDVYLDDALEVLRRAREAGEIRFVGLSDWDPAKVARLLPRVDPDVVQPYRNLLDDTWVSSGLAAACSASGAGAAFFSPLRHGLLLGKYAAPPTFPEGDHRRGVDAFRDEALLAGLRTVRRQVEARWPGEPSAMLRAVVGPLLEDSPNACVLLGMKRPAHVAAALAAAEPLEPDEAAWVRGLFARLGGTLRTGG